EAFLADGDGKPLAELYEAAVRRADDVADRLRGEAERVERLAQLRHEVESFRGDGERLAEAEQDVSRRREALTSQWAAHWSFLDGPPLTPAEMRDWLDRQGEVVRLAEQHRSAAAKAAELRKTVGDQRA